MALRRFRTLHIMCVALMVAFALPSGAVDAERKKVSRAATKASYSHNTVGSNGSADGIAEARLIDIYKLVGRGQNREALFRAQELATELPHFHLAQLVYGDLLAAQARRITTVGDVPDALMRTAADNLQELREESQRRMRALQERPPAGTIPSQFLTLSQRSRHAIAVDASRSRLYLFENTPQGLVLRSDYYISVGKAGIAKAVEGDQRTPLGVYYVTSSLNRKSLTDFYGSGALPINYPNRLDVKRGKTGSGIWLHGTPPDQFSRAPRATDGCVVLANPDLERIARTVEVRSTPVVIASELEWVKPGKVHQEAESFKATLYAWRDAKNTGDLDKVLGFYTSDFTASGKPLKQWLSSNLKTELAHTQGRKIALKDISLLRWTDSADTMVVTFAELASGHAGLTKRQYWMREGSQWKIFFEGSA